MRFKAVLFDMDGTLLDTIDDLADSVNEVLEEAGYPIHNVDKYKYFVGDGVYDLVLRALPSDVRDEGTIADFIERYRKVYNRRIMEKTKPYEGIPELLDLLQDKGIKISILSNKPDPATNVLAQKLLGRWNFDVVFGERPGIPKKPDPKGALEVAKMLDLNPSDFLYLGDTNVDMKTANAAGMHAVGVLWGFRLEDELRESGAKNIIRHPLELIDLL